jgi:hypothetical protein
VVFDPAGCCLPAGLLFVFAFADIKGLFSRVSEILF